MYIDLPVKTLFAPVLRCVLCFVLFVSSALDSKETQELRNLVNLAYDFDQTSLESLVDNEAGREDALLSFLSASAAYWQFQSDRIDEKKEELAEERLTQAIDVAKKEFNKGKLVADSRFLLGVGYCNRARFYVEQQNWIKSYMDARKGMGLLRDLIKDEPEYIDAHFALGVAECFLSDAPLVLKPLARLLGFSGSREKGVERLEMCIESGEWTSIEAAYYLGYFYYNVERNGAETIRIFKDLSARYPRNPLFGYFLGRGYQISHEPLKALEAYQRIQSSCYQVGAEDIGNWASYRIGNILHGEQRSKEALVYYNELKKRLDESTHKQEYFHRLPLKFARSLAKEGKMEEAYRYLDVMNSNWDSDTKKLAKAFRKELGSREK
ncbi:MAG: TTC39/IML2 family protein [Opitutales bacterium]|nr:TTC39/IML2 family protein [Opitutales bacterium]